MLARRPVFICVLLQLVCCYGFVLMTSGTHFDAETFEPGGAWSYDFQSTLLLNEKDGANAKDVGFYISSGVAVDSIWGGDDYRRLLKVQITKPKLHIRSRKAPNAEGFTEHKSLLESMHNKVFYVKWRKGDVEGLWIRKDEPIAAANLKKGIASLLQFKVMDQEQTETDASGRCKAIYTSPAPNTVIKTKTDCTSPDHYLRRIKKPLLDTLITSKITTKYTFAENYISSIVSTEKHQMSTMLNEKIGNEALVKQEMTFVKASKSKILKGSSFEDLRKDLEKTDGVLEEHGLLTEVEHVGLDERRNFYELIKANRNNLKSAQLGNIASAKSFIELVQVARGAKLEEISKAIGDRANLDIINQIYDILGFVQTSDSHAAAMKKLHFDKPKQSDLSERYLWALSICSQPNPEIIIDLLNKYRKTQNIPDKVKETLILSIASMAHRLDSTTDTNRKVFKDVESTIINYLDASKGDSRFPFLRALRNLRSRNAIPTLLKVIKENSLKEGVMAWKALHALEPHQVTKDVLKAAVKTYFQLDKKHDSSTRTIALEVILKNDPSEEILRDVLFFLKGNEKSQEIKKYTQLSLDMMFDTNAEFREKMRKVLLDNRDVYNYLSYQQKGLSIALVRKFLDGDHSNGSLVTMQEINGGMLKRGIINIVLDKDNVAQDIFSIGIFAGGLGGILQQSGDDTEEVAIAGLELGLLGTYIRPFVFFTGQGELMGHVWSGTASDRTPAFQVLTMLQDHHQYLRLGSGFIAELDLKGSGSIDLAGQVEISLWNRNANSLVEEVTGLLAVGMMKVDSSFVRSQVEFTMSVEPTLRLETKVDFSGDFGICMRLHQPETTFRHSTYKIERIPGSKHRIRIKKSKKYAIVARTFDLTRENSKTCRSIY